MIINQIRKFGIKLISLNSSIMNSFSSKDQENNYGVKFDQEQIRRKMKEIKDRKQSPTTKKKEEKFQFMNIDSNSQISKKIKNYRQSTNTQNLFHFTDVTLEQKPTILQITGFDADSIEIDSMAYPHSLIVFPNQVLIWEVLSVENISIDDFIILKYLSPRPTYIIIGINDPSKLPENIRNYLVAHYPNFDCLQLFEAMSQFNTTSNDDINVVAFLISK